MRATKFVESYFDAWNHCDPKAVADHLAADGIYCDVPQNTQRTHDELIAYLQQFFSETKHRYELIGEILASTNTVAFQYQIRPLENTGAHNSDTMFRGAEFMTLHYDTRAQRTAEMPASILASLEAATTAEPPDWVGRRISLSGK